MFMGARAQKVMRCISKCNNNRFEMVESELDIDRAGCVIVGLVQLTVCNRARDRGGWQQHCSPI